jgi:hypothetical protein
MTETVTLGGRQFELRPLKLGQLRHVLDALDALAGKSGGALIEAAAHIVAAGLAPAHPDIDSAAVLDLQAGLEELNAAVAAILRAAGLTPMGEAGSPDGRKADPGTASEAAAPAGSSPPSTPPSPPAAATATP